MDKRAFQDPDNAYRPVPFWAWNDWLDDKELVRQIEEMQKAGWGGFFMHSRGGLETSYMTDQWMDRVRTCVEEARRRGMHAWLYDEDKWPSGFAGGMTTLKRPEYREHALVCRMARRYDGAAEDVAVFAAQQKSGKLREIRRVYSQQPDVGLTYLHFYQWTSPLGNPWFNKTAYSDQLSVDAVREFIRNTYEAYRDQFGDDFGTVVPGVFTDEPNICFTLRHDPANMAVPWTEGFAEYFHVRYGYDLVPHLPSLFFDVDDSHRVRYHYWRAIQDRFAEAYTKQIYDWCEAHNLRLTGHYLGEDTLQKQILTAGAMMPQYEYMHYPGIDHLFFNQEDAVSLKQVDSVASQLGKERTLSEGFGGSGQELSFEGRKWIGDWECALGINLFNHHLSLYSMRGARKRDYPPNIFYQQPWWPHNRLVDDYFARLSYAMSQGRREVDTLVLHPIGSAWAVYRRDNTRDAEVLNDQWVVLSMSLLRLHYDFHYGDESIMERHARVEGKTLEIGQMRYRVVVVPPAVTLAKRTVELLQAFKAAGGVLLFCQPAPTMMEGSPDPAVPALTKGCPTLPIEEADLAETLGQSIDRRVHVTDASGRNVPHVLYHLRLDGDCHTLFLANTSWEEGGVYTVRLPELGNWELWDAVTGQVRPLPAGERGDETTVELEFAPVGSCLLVRSPGARPVGVSEAPIYGREVAVRDPWQMELLDPNALTIDYCAYRIDGGDWHGPVPHLKALEEIRAAGTGVSFALRYQWESGFADHPGLALVVERPDDFSIFVNGREVEHSPDDGYWVDTSFRRIPISDVAGSGANEVVLKSVTAPDIEIEACYLVGEFGVEQGDGGFRLVSCPTQARGGDLVLQGLPFYTGRVRLRQQVQVVRPDGAARIELDGFDAVVAVVRVNGQDAGTLVWRPHDLDISGLLVEGENTIELELVNSLRNLLGPHHVSGNGVALTAWETTYHRRKLLGPHLVGGRAPVAVGPESFADWDHWTDQYRFVRFGVDGVRIRLA